MRASGDGSGQRNSMVWRSERMGRTSRRRATCEGSTSLKNLEKRRCRLRSEMKPQSTSYAHPIRNRTTLDPQNRKPGNRVMTDIIYIAITFVFFALGVV